MTPARVLGITALGAALVSAPAHADEPSASPPKHAMWLSALPSAPYDITGAALPKAPASIPAKAVVPGLWVTEAHVGGSSATAALLSRVGKKKGRKSKPAPVVKAPTRVMATVVSSQPLLASMSVTSGTFGLDLAVSSGSLPTEPCVRTRLPEARVVPGHDAWSTEASPTYVLQDQAGPPVHVDSHPAQVERGTDAVRLMRIERLRTPAGGNASLEIIEAWVDTRTQGAQEVQRVTLPLHLLLRVPGGVDVYAFRHDHDASLVVRTPRADEHPDVSNELSWRNDDVSGSIACGHAVIPLSARALGDAETTFLVGELTRPGPPASDGERETKEIQSFRLALSSTWLGTAAEPLVSASFGWSGKPRPRPNEP